MNGHRGTLLQSLPGGPVVGEFTSRAAAGGAPGTLKSFGPCPVSRHREGLPPTLQWPAGFGLPSPSPCLPFRTPIFLGDHLSPNVSHENNQFYTASARDGQAAKVVPWPQWLAQGWPCDPKWTNESALQLLLKTLQTEKLCLLRVCQARGMPARYPRVILPPFWDSL